MRRFSCLLPVILIACQNAGASGSAPSASGSPASAAAPAAPADDLTDVDLAPIPMTIRVPKGGAGAMDMSLGAKKSVTVDIGDGSLNVQEMVEKDIGELKKGFKADKILFPFKRFTKEAANEFIVEIEPEAKQLGYIGVTVKELAGKKWICKTTGLQGVKSAELAEKQLRVCDRLKAK